MKILYISTSFPRLEESSTIYTDLAETLHDRGHDLLVVAAEEKRSLNKTRISLERGFPVLRVRIGNLFTVNLVEKGITIVTLQKSLKSAIQKHLKKNSFDFILFESPPVTTAGVVKWAMNYFNCPSYLMLKDIFPQNGVDIGIIRSGGIIHHYFKMKEKQLYQTATVIGCMSDANKKYIIKHNPWIEKEKVEIFPNTKRISYSGEKSTNYEMRRKYNIPENKALAIYGGNMGKPQGLSFLISIISECKKREDVFFLLVGRGTERQMISNRIRNENLENVLLLEALPRQDYEQLLTECDIGLVLLDRRFTIPNFPSRVLSYFEYKLPVIAATDKNTDFGLMIEKAGAGFWVYSGEIQNFIQTLDKLVLDKELRYKMGNLGRKYLEDNYNVNISADLLEKRFIVAD